MEYGDSFDVMGDTDTHMHFTRCRRNGWDGSTTGLAADRDRGGERRVRHRSV
jgi:hypothetical protein